MDKSVSGRHHIQFDIEAKAQKRAFHVITHAAYKAGYVKDENAYSEGVREREKKATTGSQDGIVIPHSKHAIYIRPEIFLVKFKYPTAWSALDGEPVQVALGLMILEGGGNVYLRILNKLARKVISKEFRTTLKIGTDVDILYEAIAAVEL